MSNHRLPQFVIISRGFFAQVLLIESAVGASLLIMGLNTGFSDIMVREQ